VQTAQVTTVREVAQVQQPAAIVPPPPVVEERREMGAAPAPVEEAPAPVHHRRMRKHDRN
jgi:hypothetical protein